MVMALLNTIVEHYNNNLRHMAEPASPAEREDADYMSVADYMALYLANAMREFAAYGSPSDEEEEIALAYDEYLRDRAAHEGLGGYIEVYAHTQQAVNVLFDAVFYFQYHSNRADVYDAVVGELMDGITALDENR